MFNFKALHYVGIISLCVASSYTYSEVYRWTDQNGQIHFGDRPPEKAVSKNISNQLEQVNIASDLSSPEMMLQHAKNKDIETKQLKEKWQEQRNNKLIKSEKCKEAKLILETIQGRVVFIDENGKDMKRSEETRKQRAEKLKRSIKKHCL